MIEILQQCNVENKCNLPISCAGAQKKETYKMNEKFKLQLNLRQKQAAMHSSLYSFPAIDKL